MKCVEPINGCIGCTACKAVCPTDAIHFTQDNRGFYIPSIDKSLCVDCGKCNSVCPIQHNEIERDKNGIDSIYLYTKNIEERKEGTSGGVFFNVAKEIIEQGGIVCGCIWDEHLRAIHVCTKDIETVKKMRGSKYVQSYMGDCYKEIKEYLKKEKPVLFSGTGCQTTALKNYIGEKQGEKLICCAVICGGVPSPLVWQLYHHAIENKAQSLIQSIKMRSKKHGWLMPEIEVHFTNGKKIQQVLLQENIYGTNFGDGLFINDQCLECPFKLGQVNADILLSDDWGIDGKRLKLSKNLGSSAVIMLTEKGKDILNRVKDTMYVQEGNIDDIIKSHHILTKNHIDNPYREEFFAELNDCNILELLNRYYIKWTQKTGMKPVTQMLYKFKLYTPIYNLLWKIRNR